MYDPSNDFLLLLTECEDKCEELRFFNPDHELLTFSNRFISLSHYETLHLKIVKRFLPESNAAREKTVPSFEELMAAYGHFHMSLEAAIIIEVARTWARQIK